MGSLKNMAYYCGEFTLIYYLRSISVAITCSIKIQKIVTIVNLHSTLLTFQLKIKNVFSKNNFFYDIT